MKVKTFSRVRPLVTPWTAAYQAPVSMGFSGQEYWSGVPLPSPSACEKEVAVIIRLKPVTVYFGKEVVLELC